MATAITPGIYPAKIIDYGLGKTQSGNGQVVVLFEFNDGDGQRHEITWYGTLKEGRGQEITMEALLTMGMKGNDVLGLAEGCPSGLLNVDQAVEISIEMDTSKKTGKTFAKVQWINPANRVMKGKLTRIEAAKEFGSLNLKGAMAAMRQKTGIKDEPRQAPKQATGTDGPNFDEDLPW